MNKTLKHLFLSGVVSTMLAFPAFAALQAGDNAPDFQAQASQADALKKGPVVVYFYPSAYTGGCNIQAHTFAVEYEKFAAAGATVIGVSLDSIERLNDFSADPEYCAGKVAVASDADGKIAQAYALTIREAAPGKKDSRGADITHGFAERTTFVVTPNNKIFATIGGLKPAENVAKALETVQQLAQKTAD
jgi:thioredoxin-dependent peroxiredoxin